MSASAEVQAYLLRQDSSWLRWRRGIFRTAIRFISFGFNRLTVSDLQHIPSSGPLIMMINHTSGLDPGLIMAVTTNRFVIPMTKIENTQFLLGRLAVWWWDCYTVRRGELDRRALSTSIELLRDGQCILIAPEGTRQRQGGAGAAARRPGLDSHEGGRHHPALRDFRRARLAKQVATPAAARDSPALWPTLPLSQG